MKLDEIRAMSDADLRTRVAELEEERFRLRFRGATETLEDPLRQRTVRRDIARVLTVLRERATAAGATAAAPAASAPKAAGQTPRRGKSNAAKTAAKAAR
jgi:large subunit ribosomal protein L29